MVLISTVKTEKRTNYKKQRVQCKGKEKDPLQPVISQGFKQKAHL